MSDEHLRQLLHELEVAAGDGSLDRAVAAARTGPHPDDEALQGVASGRLAPDAARRVRAHAVLCVACARRLQQVRTQARESGSGEATPRDAGGSVINLTHHEAQIRSAPAEGAAVREFRSMVVLAAKSPALSVAEAALLPSNSIVRGSTWSLDILGCPPTSAGGPGERPQARLLTASELVAMVLRPPMEDESRNLRSINVVGRVQGRVIYLGGMEPAAPLGRVARFLRTLRRRDELPPDTLCGLPMGPLQTLGRVDLFVLLVLAESPEKLRRLRTTSDTNDVIPGVVPIAEADVEKATTVAELLADERAAGHIMVE